MWICILILLIMLYIVQTTNKEHFDIYKSECNCLKQKTHTIIGREKRMYDTLTYDLNLGY